MVVSNSHAEVAELTVYGFCVYSTWEMLNLSQRYVSSRPGSPGAETMSPNNSSSFQIYGKLDTSEMGR